MGPKKKKKLTKEERARLREEELERIRREEELERLIKAQEAEEQQVAAQLRAQERACQVLRERELREHQLGHTTEEIARCQLQVELTEVQRQLQTQWNQYMRCDGLPDAGSPPAMHTYLHEWRTQEGERDIEAVTAKTTEILGLLSQLDELIKRSEKSAASLQNLWFEVRQEIREEQQSRLDEATYGLLRAASDLPASESEPGVVCFHLASSPHLTMSLWSRLVPPASSEVLLCNFQQMGVSLQLPPQLGGLKAAVRALWLRYDHYSDLCPSRVAPPQPDDYNQSLQAAATQWQEQEQARELADQSSTPPPADPPEDTKEEIDPPPAKNPQQNVEKEKLIRATAPHELNLRKLAVLGGVLHLDLLEQPPQPRQLSQDLSLTVLTEPLALRRVSFYARYSPPPPPEPGKRRLPEEIEAELKLQEQELEKLALVSITLPDNVLWFEPPIVVGWDYEKRYWSTEDLHDLKFYEEKQMLTFRAGRLTPLALAAFRYSNLPYQTWELRPSTGGVVLSITAAVVLVELTFQGGLVCLSQLQNGATTALQDIIGQFFEPDRLVEVMRAGGVDVFPPHDAHCYMAAVTPKQRAPERHLYQCMALAAGSHSFAWSRWNLLAGQENLVLQMRDSEPPVAGKAPSFEMLLVTSQRTCVVQCTEVSQSFSEEPAQGMNFYADLLHLLMEHASEESRARLKSPDIPLVHSLATILDTTRVLSFS